MQTFSETDIYVAAQAYAEFHGVEAVDICRNFDGAGKIIGFRLSLDTDGAQHGADEKHGEWAGKTY